MDFFTRFEQARWEFTYGAPDSPEEHNALRLISIFRSPTGLRLFIMPSLVTAIRLVCQLSAMADDIGHFFEHQAN
ncbi:hypothetical protein BIY26_07400 [Brenneria goodwinii]|uniref:Uncharacterized protein n=1 Tax=Brenneria goodwinii TaxID=1109412 RepID=A0AAE8EQC4_9GAMM|nr:hypothetical protein [Brenneria goodwinii]ATA26728.1 hypothetical protein AWC36_22945 [Brenneria goodwinii]RLM26811.1 hypothetical protein BIY26_07400 [Brenneria goodwinii]